MEKFRKNYIRTGRNKMEDAGEHLSAHQIHAVAENRSKISLGPKKDSFNTLDNRNSLLNEPVLESLVATPRFEN
jgi:hypothetical protein